MTAEVDRSQDRDTCRKLPSRGYARVSGVRRYRQEMKLVSDPSPEEGGLVVEASSTKQSASRRVKLPLSILQMAPSKRIA